MPGNILHGIAGFAKTRKGQGMTEYAVVVALAVAVAVAVLTASNGVLGAAITGVFDRVSTALGGV